MATNHGSPYPDIVKRLHDKGICDKDGKPLCLDRIVNYEDSQIVEFFNSIFLGYMNYYSFVDNMEKLTRIRYILKFSLARTLAGKHKSSVRKIFRKHGNLLTVKTASGKVVNFKDRFDWSKRRHDFKIGEPRDINTLFGILLKRRTRSLLQENCCICGSDEDIQMHHVRHIKKMNKRLDTFTQKMASINRKQIPVCQECHLKIHAGKYDGVALKRLTKQGKDHIYVELGV